MYYAFSDFMLSLRQGHSADFIAKCQPKKKKNIKQQQINKNKNTMNKCIFDLSQRRPQKQIS